MPQPRGVGDERRAALVSLPEVVGLIGGLIGVATGALSIETRVRQRRLDKTQRELQAALSVRLEHVGAVAPLMPEMLPGFRPVGDIERTTVRLFGAGAPSCLDDFPVSMNGGVKGAWTMRWRVLGDGPIFVYRGAYDFDPNNAERVAELTEPAAHGLAGRVEGTLCDQPILTSDPLFYEVNHLVDVAVEVQHWSASP